MSDGIRNTLFFVGVIAVILGIVRGVMFKPWVIPEDPWLNASIAPSLHGGDQVLINFRTEIAFGDLIRCKDPDDPTAWVIGRVAGLSNDHVELKNNALRVNGTAYNPTEACKENILRVPHPDTGHEMELNCSRVDMGSGWHFVALSGKSTRSNDVKKDVGREKLYLLSDNRDIHSDSRDFGTVDRIACDGIIQFRLWTKAGWTDSEGRLDVIR